MRALVLLLVVLATIAPAGNFRAQEIIKDWGVVYAVHIADMNRDGQPDIVAVHNTEVAWFQNPSWEKHVIASGVGKKDNVAVAIHDVNGDGRLDLVLAADWQPANTDSGGSIWYLENPGKPGLWPAVPIAEEPTMHRMRWADIDADGKLDLIAMPLRGRGTKGSTWDQAGARILVFHPPAQPATGKWGMEVADDILHETHNFHVEDGRILVASRDGFIALTKENGAWKRERFGDGQPGEAKLGHVNVQRTLASIEPYHGNDLVLYEEPMPKIHPQAAPPAWPQRVPVDSLWTRKVIDRQAFDGHGLGWADFDGDGSDELVAGWRGKPYGVALYKRSPAGEWQRTEMIDDGGMACEDLVVGDLNGDGRPDVIAGGRATRNVKIYWNEIAPKWTRHVVGEGFRNQTAVAADFTGDKRPDVISADINPRDPKVYLFAAPDWKRITLHEGVQTIHGAVMDVDGDGDLDYIGCRYSPGLIYWLERPKHPLTEKWVYHVIDDAEQGGVDGIHGLILGDVNKDGKLDVIGNSGQPKGPFKNSIAWFEVPRNVRSAQRWIRHVFANGDAPGLSHYHGFGDVNGDGRPDIASAAKVGAEGNWFAWWEQTPSGPWTKHLIATGQEGATNIHVADANRDGKPDFIASRGHGFGLVWFEAPNWTPHEMGHRERIGGPHSLAIGDIDGDGSVDAVTAAKDTRIVAWFQNDGKGGFTQRNIWEDQAAYDIRLVDMDGDGDLDVLVAGQESSNVAWYENKLKR